MCSPACRAFALNVLQAGDVQKRSVIEVGSLNINGSLRSVIETFQPSRYIGIDLQEGPGVDEICDATRVLERFGAECFDVLVSTELLEHVMDWRVVVHNFKHLLRPGGVLLVTTRSKGFPYHGHPHDFWRYEVDDMRLIFSDLAIEALQGDPDSPGVFLRARKPLTFAENDLSRYPLYSMIYRRPVPTTNVGRLAAATSTISYLAGQAIRRTLSRIVPRSMKERLR